MSPMQIDAIVFDLEIDESATYVDLNGQEFQEREKTKINSVSVDETVADVDDRQVI